MSIEEITSSLEERGIAWQAVTFALIGAVTLTALSVYSDSQHWTINTPRLAATQLHWAFIPIIVFSVERIRKMFETKTEIRRAARAQAIAKAREEGEERGIRIGEERGVRVGEERGIRAGEERIRAIRARMIKRGIELSPEDEQAIFGSNGHEG